VAAAVVQYLGTERRQGTMGITSPDAPMLLLCTRLSKNDPQSSAFPVSRPPPRSRRRRLPPTPSTCVSYSTRLPNHLPLCPGEVSFSKCRPVMSLPGRPRRSGEMAKPLRPRKHSKTRGKESQGKSTENTMAGTAGSSRPGPPAPPPPPPPPAFPNAVNPRRPTPALVEGPPVL